ncbi:dihydrodipicolinate synthase family protein [Diaminobutyricimonas sp. TR449]|uniref:dihydrodipicolinate synthase family protein n=1 Tax=Diaminobutyricimonas sp. TR449 TaxID=2708076 RepID=UPI00141DF57C|nr:dihydrodipicolinate synthase family protein [Diaminobutyricimonas sp. TR449]
MTNPAPLGTGLWGILATPFIGDNLDVDTVSVKRQVELFRDLPATGVVALGVFGEGAALSNAEQRTVIDAVVSSGNGLPTVVGLSARTTAPAVDQAHLAVDAAGTVLAGVMVQVNSASPAVLVKHLTAIHAATGAGIVLQDYPLVSGVQISSAQILATLAECPFIVAVKSEAPPTASAIAELTDGTDVPVFGGLGGVGLIDELAAGAAGAMTGFSRPEGLLAAITAWQSGGMRAAYDAFAPWLPLANFEAQPKIGLALRKEAFRRRGVFREGAVRPPAASMPAHLGPIMQQHLDLIQTAGA